MGNTTGPVSGPGIINAMGGNGDERNTARKTRYSSYDCSDPKCKSKSHLHCEFYACASRTEYGSARGFVQETFTTEDARERHYQEVHGSEIYTEKIPDGKEILPPVLEHLKKLKALGRDVPVSFLQKQMPVVCTFGGKQYPSNYNSMNSREKRLLADTQTAKVYRPSGELGQYEAHTSESGWNLPHGHHRHLLNFPAEILERILHFTLVAPEAISPLCIPTEYEVDGSGAVMTRQPSYQIRELPISPSLLHQVVFHCIRTFPNCKLGGSRGFLYTKAIAEYKKPVDATVLRVCRTFLDLGRPILYGSNIFNFDLATERSLDVKIPPALDDDVDIKIENKKKDPLMPSSELLDTELIKSRIRNLYQSKNVSELPDWMCCDPFIHFLWVIGQANASLVRNLKFAGRLLTSSKHSFATIDLDGPVIVTDAPLLNLSYHVKAYAPFLSIHCQNLQALAIHIRSFESDYKVKKGNEYAIEGLNTSTLANLRISFMDFQNEEFYAAIHAQVHAQEYEDLDDETKEKRKEIEKMYLKAIADEELKLDNRTAEHLKPLIEDITSKLNTSLRAVTVTRYQPSPWWTRFEHMMYLKHEHGKADEWKLECAHREVDMGLTGDANLAIVKRFRKRMRDDGEKNEGKLMWTGLMRY